MQKSAGDVLDPVSATSKPPSGSLTPRRVASARNRPRRHLPKERGERRCRRAFAARQRTSSKRGERNNARRICGRPHSIVAFRDAASATDKGLCSAVFVAPLPRWRCWPRRCKAAVQSVRTAFLVKLTFVNLCLAYARLYLEDRSVLVNQTVSNLNSTEQKLDQTGKK